MGISEKIQSLYLVHFGKRASSIEQLPRSGSNRQYFRLRAEGKTVIGTYNEDRKENEAFFYFTHHFHKAKVSVPELLAISEDRLVYLQYDLGNDSLYDQVIHRKSAQLDEGLFSLYQKSLSQLALMQTKAAEGLDFSYCYPIPAFDEQAMLWDLNYFKYQFLKIAQVPFDEWALEQDFKKLIHHLSARQQAFFMFRDFQSRNIIIKDNEPYFIDYQGGRKGALAYDVISLLWQAKAKIPLEQKSLLVEHYITALQEHCDYPTEQFKQDYEAYMLIRFLQVLGAYGFRGLFERKSHFLQSIPLAIDNLAWWFKTQQLGKDLPEIGRIIKHLTTMDSLQSFDKTKGADSPLQVQVYSFSYKRAIPNDPSGNGGGFVFDCRALHNPGRYQPYKKQTGRDQPVIDFLLKESNIKGFLENAFALVDNAVENYIERGFTSLSVSFGCTGGQHRSVYSADQMTQHLEDKYGVKVKLQHIEQELKNWVN